MMEKLYNGGILTGEQIFQEIQNGNIAISDFMESRLNPNSYNLRIGNKIATIAPTRYESFMGGPDPTSDGIVHSVLVRRELPVWELDIKKPIELKEETIEETGYRLNPGVLYLIATEEKISCGPYVPIITGRSSMGRMGIAVHQEAGFGDIGYNGCFTMQMKVTFPTTIYPHAEMAQVYFITPYGPITRMYSGKYQGSTGISGSKSYQDFSSD